MLYSAVGVLYTYTVFYKAIIDKNKPTIRRPRGVSDPQQLRFFASDPQSLQALLVGGCPPPDLGRETLGQSPS